MRFSLFILLLLFCIPAWTVEITIVRQNHLGFKKIDILQKENKKYTLNGQVLSTTLPAPVLKSWEALENQKAFDQTARNCAAGFFNFEKRTATGTEKWSGCTAGSQYGNLIRNLETIRHHARGN